MAAGPTIIAKFLADTSKLTSEVDKATGTASSSLTSFAKGAATAIGGAFVVDKILDFGKAAVGAASDLSESVSKVGVVFGEQSGAIESWASDAADSMGLSEQAALAAAGTYGNLAVSMGLPEEKAADMSTSLTELAVDLASFNNMPVDEALKALQSGLTGETEPLKKFGINLNAAAIEAEAMALGLSDGKAPLDAAAKAQASYSLMLKQSSTAQGDFARTSDGMANQQKIAAANMADLQATIGTLLLPVLGVLAGILNDTVLPAFEAVFGWFAENQAVLIGAIIAIGAVLLPMFISWAAAALAAAAATIAAAAPFIAIGVAVGALAYLIITHWETIKEATVTAFNAVKDAIMTAFNWVKDNWPLLLTILTGPIGAAVWLIKDHWDQIKSFAVAVWDWFNSVWSTVVDVISAPVEAAVAIVEGAWELISDAGVAVWDWLNDTWDTVTDVITAPIEAARDVVVEVWDTMKEAATGLWKWVTDKFKAIGDFISGAVDTISGAIGRVVDVIKGPINLLIKGWNSLDFTIPRISLPSVEIPFIGTIGGGGFGPYSFGLPNIPLLAGGGVLTAPTLFVGGEAGTEIVAPEDMLRDIIRQEGGGSYTLNIYPRRADVSDIAYGFRRLELMAGMT